MSRGILGRMKEVLAMWRMVRAAQMWKAHSARHEIEKNTPNPQTKREEFAGFLNYNKEPRIPRSRLINPYLRMTKDWEYSMACTEIDEYKVKQFEDRVKEKWLDAHSLIENCVDHEPAYMKQDEQNPELVYLTAAGKMFSGRFGLSKEIIRQIGPDWAVVAWLVSLLTLANMQTIWDFISLLSPWW